MLIEMKILTVRIIGDSQLVIKQLTGEYRCLSDSLAEYHALATELLNRFMDLTIQYTPRSLNQEANEMAQVASGVKWHILETYHGSERLIGFDL